MDPLLASPSGGPVGRGDAASRTAPVQGPPIGSLGRAASFSFYANKTITTGEGGMVTTNDAELARVARRLRDHAFSDERHFWHKYLGFNYRMTNLQAALGVAQTERLEEFVEIRRTNAARYTRALSTIPGLTLPVERPWARNVYWMYGVVVEAEFGISRDELRRRLARRGIRPDLLHPDPLPADLLQAFRGSASRGRDACHRSLTAVGATLTGRSRLRHMVRRRDRAADAPAGGPTLLGARQPGATGLVLGADLTPSGAQARRRRRGRARPVVAGVAPAVILSCTAFNRVDDTEADPAPAFAVNAVAVHHLARLPPGMAPGSSLQHRLRLRGAGPGPYAEGRPRRSTPTVSKSPAGTPSATPTPPQGDPDSAVRRGGSRSKGNFVEDAPAGRRRNYPRRGRPSPG
jgi:hypothetical protein